MLVVAGGHIYALGCRNILLEVMKVVVAKEPDYVLIAVNDIYQTEQSY